MLKDINQLNNEIDDGVHTNGPMGKTTANGLNSLLKSLAVELISQQQEAVSAASHKADLDDSGHIPASQLPGYVDDVLEAATFEALPAAGEAGKIYMALDTNMLYRWDGKYILLTSSGLTINQVAALNAAPLLSNTNPVASLSDVSAPAELRRTTGSILPFATAAAAITAADAGDTLVLRGIHPEISVTKTLHLIAYGATLAGVVISWKEFPGGLRSTWKGGRLTGRFFTGRTGVPESPHKCQISDVDFGLGSYLQSHTNDTEHKGAADEFSFFNCHITHIQFNQRTEDVYNQRQSLYFSGCSFVPDTAGAVFRGMMYSQSTISAHNCRFQPQPGNVMFDAKPNEAGKLSLHGLTTVALPVGFINLLSNGLQVITNADPFAFPQTPEKLSAQSDTSVLEFVFESGFADNVVRTMGIRQAGTYTTQQLQNVSKVMYKVNNLEIKQLPLEIISGSVLELIITRVTGNQAAIISLLN